MNSPLDKDILNVCILQINKSFRIKRSQSSRDLHSNKTKQRFVSEYLFSNIEIQIKKFENTIIYFKILN